MKLADAFIPILPDDSKLGSIFNRAKQTTNNFVNDMVGNIARIGSQALMVGIGAVATGVIGIGVAAFNTSSQIKDASNLMVSQFDATEERATELGNVVKSVWGNNFGGSIAEVGEAVGFVNQQLNETGQLSDDAIGRAAETAFALRDAYGVDVSESVLAANNLMEKFGLTSDEAFGFITGGMQQGLNASGDFLESINEYSVQFADGGANAGQFFAIMETGLQAGMLGTDKAADLFKEFRLRIQDGSDSTRDALNAIGLDADGMYEQMADGSLTAIDAMQLVKNALSNVDDENLRMQAGVALMGSQFEDLGQSAVLGLEFIDTALEDVMGSTDSLNKQYDNWPSMWEGIKRQGQLALLPIGDILLKIAQQAMPLVNQAFGWFQSNIIPIIEMVAEKAQLFLDTLFGGIQAGTSPLQAFKDALAAIIPPELMAQIEPVIDAIARFIGKTQEFVSTHAEEIKGALLAIGGVLAAAGIVSGIMAIVGAIGAILSPVGLVVAAIGVLGAAWAGNWGGIQEKTKAALDFIQNLIQTVFAAIQAFWQEHGDTIIATATTAWEGIQAAIDTVLAVIDEIWQAFKAAFEGDWYGFGENLREAWILAWNAIKDFLGTVWEGLIKPALASLITSVLTLFADTDWKELGSNIIQGMINGILNGIGAIQDAARAAAQAALDAAKGLLGIESPSKVMARLVGEPITQGVAVGMLDATPAVERASGAIAELVQFSPQVGLAGAGGAGGGTPITLDLRGAVVASQSQLEQWIQGALNKTGQRANQIRRTRG